MPGPASLLDRPRSADRTRMPREKTSILYRGAVSWRLVPEKVIDGGGDESGEVEGVDGGFGGAGDDPERAALAPGFRSFPPLP